MEGFCLASVLQEYRGNSCRHRAVARDAGTLKIGPWSQSRDGRDWLHPGRRTKFLVGIICPGSAWHLLDENNCLGRRSYCLPPPGQAIWGMGSTESFTSRNPWCKHYWTR